MKTNRNCLNRTAIALIAGLALLCIRGNAQRVVGIYQTDTDFKSGLLAYTKEEKGACFIKVRSAVPKKSIKIKCGKEVSYLSKDSVYGYKDKAGTIYRFYKGLSYTLINPGEEIQLYQLQLPGPSKEQPFITTYFFSRNLSAAIVPLTINNLLRIFSDNKRFSEIVEVRYRHDNELMEFDAYHKKYKLNRFLETSKN